MNTCDYFMISKNDEKRKLAERDDKKSPSCLFFEFFTEFIDKVDMAIKAKPKKKMNTAVGGGIAAMMQAANKK